MVEPIESRAAAPSKPSPRVCDDLGMLPDGTYDAFVVWAEDDDGALKLDLTITSGPHKGEVVSISGPSDGDPLALTGMPCTLVVSDGEPRLEE